MPSPSVLLRFSEEIPGILAKCANLRAEWAKDQRLGTLSVEILVN